ncbi:MAG: T9SS type A sorting domain-containing protein [Chitinophagaceae bacterium]|nr:MAG: T9SS type A sorting domain-containing protein [Chitinophagaceae bacterium]
MRNIFTMLCGLLLAAAPPAFSQTPVITSISPAQGSPGSSVVITGSSFSPVAADNAVFFGAVRANVTAASAGSLTVTVPTGATYQPVTVAVNNRIAWAPGRFAITYSSGGGALSATSFAPAQSLLGTGDIVEGDFDGDGRVDLVYTSFSNDLVNVMRNTTSGTSVSFAVSQIFGMINPLSIEAADLDADGKLDLIVTGGSGAWIYVLKNQSTPGAMSFATRVVLGTGSEPRQVAVGDLDGDGLPDLAVSNKSSASVSLLRNTSTTAGLAFAPKVDIATVASTEGVAIGDIDGDGKADVAVTGSNTGAQFSVLRNTSTPGNFSFAARTDVTTGSFPWDVLIADLNNDGQNEVLVANNGSDDVRVFRNAAAGSIALTNVLTLPVSASPRCLEVADLNADGKPEILASCYFMSSVVSVLGNTSTGSTLSFAPQVAYATGAGTHGIAAADLDGDGLTDIMTSNTQGVGSLSFLRNNQSILPRCPELLSPAASATGIQGGRPLTLRWRKDAASTGYVLRLSAGGNPAVATNVTDTFYTFTPQAGLMYAWSVTPANFTSLACETRQFFICSSVSANVFLNASATGVCTGDSVRIRVLPTGMNPVWFRNDTAIGHTGDEFFAKTAGVYTVRVSTTGTCLSDASNTITLQSLATPTKPVITAAGPFRFCVGDSVRLSAAPGASFQWYFGNTALTGATGASVAARDSGLYYAVAIDGATGCRQSSDAFTVHALTKPAVPVITANGNVLSVANNTMAYNWYRDNNLLVQYWSNTLTATQSGVYKVEAFNNENCTVFSAPFTFTSTAVSELSLDGATVNIYPNPVVDVLQVNVSGRAARNLGLRVLDAQGRQLMTRTLKGGLNRVPVSGLPAGVYHLVLTGPSGTRSLPILKASR